MPTQSTLKPILACALTAVLTACTHSSPTEATDQSSDFAPVHEANGIQISGVFNPPDQWDLHLATPLLESSQAATESGSNSGNNEYWVRINDATERQPVTVNEVATGPSHFTLAVAQADLPVRQLTLYKNDTQLQIIENEHPLPAIGQWLPTVKLTTESTPVHSAQNQLCLTWPDQLFEQASLLTVSEQGRLQLQQQSTSSPLCVDPIEENHAQLRINLRNPVFAVQLKSNR
ncbi:hypothetical protein CWE12_08675 [Aliidiomarina sedimenti]|uniref:Uncharacterized protein n=1 Tax=Aliidiomarina sedimenti TaxID=1933879 RepID=A0ABY0BZ37_9GAMM|nr:hypothetical protein [Aliidiomarina sedimenti]RUO30024.1 hypothetical protein CWE12_08675 [Aliidiomarina sedimenti]